MHARWMGLALGLWMASAAWAGAPSEDGESSRSWHRVVGLLQYVQSDYPNALKSGAASELAEQEAFAQEAVSVAREELGPGAQLLLPRLTALASDIEHAAPAEKVARECGALVVALTEAGHLTQSPKQTPDLARGQAIYLSSCAACHGGDGQARTPAADALQPHPTNFQDPEVMGALSPYKSFNVTSFGVTGTAMPAFPTLSEPERWDVAFYVATLRQAACTHTPPRTSLDVLAGNGDLALGSRFGPAEVACLRRVMPRADEAALFSDVRTGLDEAVRLAQGAHFSQARQALLDVYLTGIEPLEPLLRARNAGLVQKMEASFLNARLLAEQKDPRAVDELARLSGLVEEASRPRAVLPRAASVFWLAWIIVLREGFEALIVITALLAILKKMRETDKARVVHAGWVSAILVGAVLFAFGRKALAGANRELLEGVTGLLAAAMLIYSSLWLNARVNIRKFMGDLRERMQGAAGRGSALGLFFIAFMAMFRESFETALFLEGLSIDSGTGATLGALAGVASMVVFAIGVNRVGYRLPMKAMFKGSTVLLYATAVALVGKGLHALQEIGYLPLHPVRFVTVDVLGLFPDAVTLWPQTVLVLAPLGWWLVRRRLTSSARRSEVSGASHPS